MKELLEFAGAHPFVAVLSLMVLAHMPIAIIRALKNKPPYKDTDGN